MKRTMEPQNCLGFRQHRDLRANRHVVGMKRAVERWKNLNYEGSPIFPQNWVNFGLLTAEIMWLLVIHPLQFSYIDGLVTWRRRRSVTIEGTLHNDVDKSSL